MENQLATIGIVFVLVGVFLLIAGSLLGLKTAKTDSKLKYSIFGLIGPIPFGFANDKRMLYFSIALTLILLVFFYFFLKKPI